MYVPYAGHPHLIVQENKAAEAATQTTLSHFFRQLRRLVKQWTNLRKERWMQA